VKLNTKFATAVAALAVGLATLAVTGPAQGLNTGKTGDPDATSFPAHYTDDLGTSLTLCVDGTAACGKATPASDGAGGPVRGVGDLGGREVGPLGSGA